ncbi:receptor-like protein EIX1 [Pistacia vera]|uniref:receptor-like protein EIX1 n=1 Tax=Pistacia vera TaxID=55513 RepID=UPI0012637E95|nr:receptor-like protein EIX1 [Pistacia vera]
MEQVYAGLKMELELECLSISFLLIYEDFVCGSLFEIYETRCQRSPVPLAIPVSYGGFQGGIGTSWSVIGKGGETIKNMQARTRAQVIPLHLPPGNTSTEWTVQIDGSSEQIESAKQLFMGKEIYEHVEADEVRAEWAIGIVPTSLGTLTSLRSLYLRKNNLNGTIPISLKNCSELLVLDIGENELAGNVASWIGEGFSKLMILNLRSNKFDGVLPVELCHLASLQILDLAYNNLSGAIPRCIDNFSAMVTMNPSGNKIEYVYQPHTSYLNLSIQMFLEDALVVGKGKMAEYNTILNLVRSIDLSKNNLSGEIPNGSDKS